MRQHPPSDLRARTRAQIACGQDATAHELLPIRLRLADGRVLEEPLAAWRHRSLQLGLLHSATAGLIEVNHGRREPGGRTRWNARGRPDRPRPDVYWPGGAAGVSGWLEDILAKVASVARLDRWEVAVAPAVRNEPYGSKSAVVHTRCLWLDIDEPRYLPRLHAFLERFPAHLRVESAGSGGEHAYWLLERPIPALHTEPDSGRQVEWIERAHRRLMEEIGVRMEIDGRSVLCGVDLKCKDRSRVMRLAGTVNWKSGRHARIIEADFHRAPYRFEDLILPLPDPPEHHTRWRRPARCDTGAYRSEDPYKQIEAVDYFRALTGQEPDSSGNLRCPSPWHEDRNPSCHVTGENPFMWQCQGCDAGGSIYDLASILKGGPIRDGLRGEAFRAARIAVVAAFGERR